MYGWVERFGFLAPDWKDLFEILIVAVVVYRALLVLAGTRAIQMLLGASRKAFIGALLGGAPAAERDAGTLGACVAGLARGARLFRVHDVRGARQALDVAWAVLRLPERAP